MPNSDVWQSNSTPSSSHFTSKSTISSANSTLAVGPADRLASPTPSWSAWPSHRSCSAATPSAVGCALPTTASATSSPTCPASPPTTSVCARPPRCSHMPSVIWPDSPHLGGINSAFSTRPRFPVAPPARRSSARSWPAGPTTATAPPTPASSGASASTSSPPPTAPSSPGHWPTPNSVTARSPRPCSSTRRRARVCSSLPTRDTQAASSRSSCANSVPLWSDLIDVMSATATASWAGYAAHRVGQ